VAKAVNLGVDLGVGLCVGLADSSKVGSDVELLAVG
jgi:hypothetical protein